jgi:hypothetical protein
MTESKGRTLGSLDNLAEGGDRCIERRMEECTCCMEWSFVLIIARQVFLGFRVSISEC